MNEFIGMIEISTICSRLGCHAPSQRIISCFRLASRVPCFWPYSTKIALKKCHSVVNSTAVWNEKSFCKQACWLDFYFLFFCIKVLGSNGLLAEGTESLRITATSASCQRHEGTLRAGRSDENSAAVALPFPLRSVAI